MMTSSDHFSARPVEQIVIVGASLAGLRAAEALRNEGFNGKLTLIGDEPYAPYDRPPLSKSVLTGWLPPDHIFLPQLRTISAEWLLGVPASGLNTTTQEVLLADGRRIPFDKLLIATGTRARPWPDEQQAKLDGVFTIRTIEDGMRLRERLATGPQHVLVIGAGFIGSEVASVCHELGLKVTVAERSAAPLAGALGGTAGMATAHLQRAQGIDLRCFVTVMTLEGDAQGHLCRAQLSDGDELEVDVAVVSLGALRNVEWLSGAHLAADARGVVCDASCRAFDADGIVTDDIFVAGDVARWPHPLFDGQLLAVEHWDNAVDQATTAAHNMLCSPSKRRAHRSIPSFWSNQFGLNIKSVGLPTIADQVMVTQGAITERRFVAVYGQKGRLVAVVTVNMPRWLEFYEQLIETRAPFPPKLNASDQPAIERIFPVSFPTNGQATHSSTAILTGPGPSSPASVQNGATSTQAIADPRVPPNPTLQ